MTTAEKLAAFEKMCEIADKGDHAELRRNKEGYVISAVRKKIIIKKTCPNVGMEKPSGATSD